MHKRIALIAGLTASGLLLAACSSSGGNSSGTTTQASSSGTTTQASSSPTTQADSSAPGSGVTSPTGSPIKIGYISAVGAPGFDYPDYEAAAKASARGINARGGVNGHPVQVISCNGQADENKEADCARQLISDGVVAVDAFQTGNTGAQLFKQAGIAMVGTLQGVTPLSNMFAIDGGSVYIFAADIALGKEAGLTKVYVPYVDIPQLGPIVDAIKKAATKSGVTITGTAAVPLTAADFSSYATAAVRSGADAVILPLTPTQVVGVVKSVHQLDPKMKFLAAPSFGPKDYAGLGSASDDLLIACSVPPASDTSNPQVQQYVADMKAEAASGDKDADLGTARLGSEWDWVTIQAIAKVASGASGDVTKQSILNGFKNAGDLGMSMLPGWTPSKVGPAVNPRASNGNFYGIKVENGKEVLDPAIKNVDVTALLS